MLQPKPAITPKVCCFFFLTLFSLGLAYLGVFTLARDNQGAFVFFFPQARWGLSQYRPGRKSNHEARERARGGKRAPDEGESEPRREMQAKEQGGSSRNKRGRGQDGHSQTEVYVFLFF